jgi:hypothetical protein
MRKSWCAGVIIEISYTKSWRYKNWNILVGCFLIETVRDEIEQLIIIALIINLNNYYLDKRSFPSCDMFFTQSKMADLTEFDKYYIRNTKS